jgi:4-hydroxy-4-methyl-2-oxoglutarate aldolase
VTATPPVSAVADVLALRGLDGWLTPPLAPVVPAAAPASVTARTVRLEASETGPGLAALYELLDEDLMACALVISTGTGVTGAVWGEILSRAARLAQTGAVLVDGAVRDVAAMTAERVPVFARHQMVVGPNGRAHVTAIDEPIEIDGVEVCGGDTIVFDSSGVVRVRAGDASDVLCAADVYAAAEQRLLEALAAGEPLSTAYRIKRQVVQELQSTRGR